MEDVNYILFASKSEYNEEESDYGIEEDMEGKEYLSSDDKLQKEREIWVSNVSFITWDCHKQSERFIKWGLRLDYV